jgi:hypothetical protein
VGGGVVSDQRTPPQIIAAADRPACALAAFIAQELEAWGFKVEVAGVESPVLLVKIDDAEYMVGVAKL